MALDLIAELEELLDAFERARVQFALCGGIAVTIYGHPRTTMDIDVLLPPDQLAAALRAARDCGFDVPARKMVFGLRTGTPRELYRVSKLDPATNNVMSAALLVVGPGLQDVWTGRSVVQWRQRQLPIISLQGLVTMKRLAGRPQDLADIAALEGSHDEEA
jgi:hypothetical protein